MDSTCSELDGEVVRWRRKVTYRLAGGLISGATYSEADQEQADRVFSR